MGRKTCVACKEIRELWPEGPEDLARCERHSELTLVGSRSFPSHDRSTLVRGVEDYRSFGRRTKADDLSGAEYIHGSDGWKKHREGDY